MRRILFSVVLLLWPVSALAQSDPIDRAVRLEELSTMYQEQSDSESNKEFRIEKASGSAQAAIGTEFSRESRTYRILRAQERVDTYDAVKADTFPRVVFYARQLIKGPPPPPPPPPPDVPEGPEILVTIDYKPTSETFKAYVAEVTKRRGDDRWEFTKVSGSPDRP